jgi:pyruvate,orthophosphate dikinase
VLIHFLRKQSHVESSNRIVGFMEAVLKFWETREKNPLEPFVPPNIYRQIDTEGVYIEGVHRAVSHLKQKEISLPHDLLSIPWKN